MGVTNPSVTPIEPEDHKPLQVSPSQPILKGSQEKIISMENPPPKKLSVSNLSSTQTDFSSLTTPRDNGNGSLYTNSKVFFIIIMESLVESKSMRE